jgi:predicted alpha-1,6-mannanase (GH76 family)
MLLMLQRFTLLSILFFLHSCTGAAQEQQVQRYKEYTKIIHSNIDAFFYDSTSMLYKEAKERSKDDKEFSYLWPLCALVQAANEMETLHPGEKHLQKVLKAIDQYYSNQPPAPGYEAYPVNKGEEDRFYDDNQWIGIALIDAHARTKQQQYLATAQMIYRFMMTGYSPAAGGGLYWKEKDSTTKNTCSNGPGIVLALKLYKATNEKAYLDTALLLYKWTNKVLQSPEGIYYDAIKLPSLQIDKRTYTYNTGTMLESNVLLYEITKEEKYLKEAQRIGKAALHHFYKKQRLPDHYWFNAVLLRGYEALYKIDGNRIYIDAFVKDADAVWQLERDKDQLLGKHQRKELIFQAAMMEIYARLALLVK